MSDTTTPTNARDRILQTASRLFQLQGYSGTGLNQIIEESGSPKGSLYYYFPKGKEQLALEAIKITDNIVRRELKSHLNHYSDPIEAVQSIIQGLADKFCHPEDIEGVPIGLIALETWSRSDDLRHECEKAFEGWESLYTAKLIENGFSKELAMELAVLINSMIEGALTISVTKQTNTPLLIVKNQIPQLLHKKTR
ncbi:TetR/AcrR family transcriptional regulator [Salipaludibacillus sp. HK11]|uniref:TetR/AcrR family transcriptional regulator n=1 Tax=Salipaludibacillus sp. HK11 TaxID=3394320 RepID=UPI0039FD05DF